MRRLKDACLPYNSVAVATNRAKILAISAGSAALNRLDIRKNPLLTGIS
jgi:hypothetical protein